MAKVKAAPMTYIGGEEMSSASMRGVDKGLEMKDKRGALALLVAPYVDTKAWKFFDFSVENRDRPGDPVVKDAVKHLKETGVCFKEQTITVNKEQAEKLKHGDQRSPNHILREALDGYVIERGVLLPRTALATYRGPVTIMRYPLGDPYAAKHVLTDRDSVAEVTVTSKDGKIRQTLKMDVAKDSAFTFFSTPLDNLAHMAEYAFDFALKEGSYPIWVDKGTAFKYQQPAREIIKAVYYGGDFSFIVKDGKVDLKVEKEKGNYKSSKRFRDKKGRSYADRFRDAEIADELSVMLSDAGAMHLVNRKNNLGGFVMLTLNYDGDVFQDIAAMYHLNPAMVYSKLMGRNGAVYDAGHGTDPKNFQLFMEGKPTQFNPISQLIGLWAAMDEAAAKQGAKALKEVRCYTETARSVLMKVIGRSIDLGSTTEQILAAASKELATAISRCGL